MTLTELLATRSVVLLDFDGPVCAVFGGEHSAYEVARQLADYARARSIDLPEGVDTSGDPFEVLRASAAHGPATTAIVEAGLRDAEVRAVATAPMTHDLPAVLAALRDSGHTITVVSNNSDAAVRAFLTAHGIQEFFAHVVARNEPDPALLKPNPHLVRRAISTNQATPNVCVLVGDSTTDIVAAHDAGTAAIAYANSPGKRDTLAAYRPEALIDHLGDIAAAVVPCVS